MNESVAERIDRLHSGGIIDLHFDLPMDLYEKRDRKNVLETELLREFEEGNVGVVSRSGTLTYRIVTFRKQVCAWPSIKSRGCTLRLSNAAASRSAKAIAKFRKRAEQTRSRCSSRWRE